MIAQFCIIHDGQLQQFMTIGMVKIRLFSGYRRIIWIIGSGRSSFLVFDLGGIIS